MKKDDNNNVDITFLLGTSQYIVNLTSCTYNMYKLFQKEKKSIYTIGSKLADLNF